VTEHTGGKKKFPSLLPHHERKKGKPRELWLQERRGKRSWGGGGRNRARPSLEEIFLLSADLEKKGLKKKRDSSVAGGGGRNAAAFGLGGGGGEEGSAAGLPSKGFLRLLTLPEQREEPLMFGRRESGRCRP